MKLLMKKLVKKISLTRIDLILKKMKYRIILLHFDFMSIKLFINIFISFHFLILFIIKLITCNVWKFLLCKYFYVLIKIHKDFVTKTHIIKYIILFCHSMFFMRYIILNRYIIFYKLSVKILFFHVILIQVYKILNYF